MNRRQTGAEYETVAAQVLEAAGYQILERNFRCRQGEIDIIARHGGYLVFIEVKYRRDGGCGSPEEAVGRKKQQTIWKTARFYLHRYGYSENIPCRFDVVCVEGKKVRIWEDAFWG